VTLVIFAQAVRQISQELWVIVWGRAFARLALARATEWATEGQIEQPANRSDEKAEQDPGELRQNPNRVLVGAGGEHGNKDREDG
jgi:hypothetical protein